MMQVLLVVSMMVCRRANAAGRIIGQEPQPVTAFVPRKGFLWLGAQKTLHRVGAGEHLTGERCACAVLGHCVDIGQDLWRFTCGCLRCSFSHW